MVTEASVPSDPVRRLAQVESVARRQWYEHAARCRICGSDTDALCSRGLVLYTTSRCYAMALLTVRDRAVWQ